MLDPRCRIVHRETRGNDCLLAFRRCRQERIPPDLIALISDSEFIAPLQIAFQNANPVDANAIGAAKIAHDQRLSDLGDAAMTARNLGRFELDVAFRIPAQKQDGFVQKNAGSAVYGLELRRHRNAHSDESCTTPCIVY